jgi:sulfate permease, SulP family
MPHRAHLFSLRIGHALRESCIDEPYSLSRFKKDTLAGVTVGIIAIPLAMALAIASGVAPQYGLYSAAIAGFIIALTGGSRFSISGPTAAFVVILYPITQKYGLSGLMLASLMAGMMLIIMALFRLGRLIEYIPETVTLGFTGGIAVAIATLQINDFFGLAILNMPEHYIDKINLLVHSISHIDWPNLAVSLITLFIMILWPYFKTSIPAHLPAIISGSIFALIFNQYGFSVETIASRFDYMTTDGTSGQGIPPFLPNFTWPWQHVDSNSAEFSLNWQLFRDLLPSAFAIAMLGAIESLLCAVVVDGMTGKRHSANSELLGQGIGNIVTPFFGGVTATAAIARSATNVKAGAESPIAAMIHALVILLGILFFSQWLGYLPMSSMAALLMVVAWNMSEAPKSIHLIKTAQTSDCWILFSCFFLTVFFDMVIAVTAGIILAAILFMKQIAEMTRVIEITHNKQYISQPSSPHFRVFKITGPLFFAAADKIFGELTRYAEPQKKIILYMDNVTLLDAGGISALTKLIAHCKKMGTQLILTDIHQQPMQALKKANIESIEGVLHILPDLQRAIS